MNPTHNIIGHQIIVQWKIYNDDDNDDDDNDDNDDFIKFLIQIICLLRVMYEE